MDIIQFVKLDSKMWRVSFRGLTYVVCEMSFERVLDPTTCFRDRDELLSHGSSRASFRAILASISSSKSFLSCRYQVSTKVGT